MRLKRSSLLALLLIFVLIMAACNQDTPPPAAPAATEVAAAPAEATEEPATEATEEPEAEATEEPAEEATEEPAEETVEGAAISEVVIVEEPSAAAAVSRLEAEDIDIYAYSVSEAEVFNTVQNSPNLKYSQSFGSYNDLTFNPVGPVFENGSLNPFAVPAVRSAMNKLVDRNYIVQEIFNGLAVPKYFPINGAFPDYARLVDVARPLELQYAPNAEDAEATIAAEMEALGAELVDGKWQYEGNPVTLIFLIRTEDERREIGDYISNLLEDIGFTVTRDYRTSAEASPVWAQGDPAEGQWHLYTGGWVTTAISRDQGSNFDFFYTDRGLGSPLWQAYTPTVEFDAVAQKLANNEFETLDERTALFAEALDLALQDSVRLWLVDRLSFSPYRSNIAVASDLAGGIYGSWLWAHTLKAEGDTDGSVTIAMPAILNDPWNPINGSNFIYDTMLIRATGDQDVFPDPFTGLFWPQRIESAEVVIKEGLPVVKTLDWVDLQFAAEITVPDDAWVDWDATEQRFITASEKYTETMTANRKSTVTYPADLFDLTWHDGSQISMADIILGMILTFDQSKEASPIYDAATVPGFEAFMDAFRGFKIVQTDPLVIEFYSDAYFLDAEWNVVGFFPYGLRGPTPWHTVAMGIMAQQNGELAFSADKAEELGVEWMSYIAGPSLEILAKYVDQAAGEGFVPYAAALSEYVGEDEVASRWQNLSDWYAEKGHFWVGSGPFYLEEAFPVEGTVQLRRNESYPDAADKWERFETPMIAEVELDGPSRVTVGDEATFEVYVDFQGEPYAMDMINDVQYLVFDAVGALAFKGSAEAVDNGLWEIVLTAEQTAELEAGANRLEVAVVPGPVSLPTFATLEFVTVP